MNSTNRGLNRLLLALFGLITGAVGVSLSLASFWPAARDQWGSATSAAVEWGVTAHERTLLGGTPPASGLLIAGLALMVVLVVAFTTVIVRLGGGASSAVIRDEGADGSQGAVTITQQFIAEAVTGGLQGCDDVLAVRAEGRNVRGTRLLHVSVTPRKHTSPKQIADTVTTVLENLNTLTGSSLRSLVTIRSGLRSRLAAEQSRVK